MAEDTEDLDQADPLISTGVPGLDDVLGGGLLPRRLYLIEGTPGSGKTTLALQFLLDGASKRIRALRDAVGDRSKELRGVAHSHGWDLDGIRIRELLPTHESLQPDEQYTMFHPSEVELSETTSRSSPTSSDSSRRASCSIRCRSCGCWPAIRCAIGARFSRSSSFSRARHCTVLLLDDMTATDHDLQVQSIAHGVLRLEQINPEYGAARRRLVVLKYRGAAVPRRLSRLHDHSRRPDRVSAAGRGRAPAADEPQRSSPAASRRSMSCSAAASRGHQHADRRRARHRQVDARRAVRRLPRRSAADGAALFIFDESLNTLRTRCAGLGMDLQPVHRFRPRHACSRSTRPNCRRANWCTTCRTAVTEQACSRGRDRQPERLSERDAGRALPDRPTARAADVPGPARRRDDADRRAARLIGTQMQTPSTPAIWPTR